jgi:phosphatidylinositol alpha-1,6-mannosyltransferase
VREILPELVKAKPDLCLLIVGDAPKDALAAEAEPPAAILATAQKAGVSDNLRWIGSLFGNDLSAAYFAADVHVFPVREIPNDPEGFGMVAIEAAAHGLPTVAYATGGVVDAVSEGLSGLLVKPGDSAGFTAAVDQLLRSPLPAGEEQRFAQEFAWNRFGAKLASALASCEQKHGKF